MAATQNRVKKNLTAKIGPRKSGGAYSVSELLAVFSHEDYMNLVRFARARLRSATSSSWLQGRLAGTEPEDMVAEAVLKLQLGENNPFLGRRLKPCHRANMKSFLGATKAIIGSDITHLVGAARHRYQHVHVSHNEAEADAVDPAATEDPYELLSRRDLHHVLFDQLYMRIRRKRGLLAVVRDWESRFLCDNRIGARGLNSNLVHRVRKLAREILAELAAEFSSAGGDGREILF
jgi:hypothetical protein